MERNLWAALPDVGSAWSAWILHHPTKQCLSDGRWPDICPVETSVHMSLSSSTNTLHANTIHVSVKFYRYKTYVYLILQIHYIHLKLVLHIQYISLYKVVQIHYLRLRLVVQIEYICLCPVSTNTMHKSLSSSTHTIHISMKSSTNILHTPH